MSDDTKIVTGLGKAELHRVLVRNIDLTKDILGKLSFGQMTFLMLVGRIPTEAEGRMTDALLNVLVEHGMVGNIVAARLTVSTAPEAIQGAVAAALLGAGSVHLGSSEYCAKMLQDALPLGSGDADLAAVAQAAVGRPCQPQAAACRHRTRHSLRGRPSRRPAVRDRRGDGCPRALLRAAGGDRQGRRSAPQPAPPHQRHRRHRRYRLGHGAPVADGQGLRPHRPDSGRHGPHRRGTAQPHASAHQQPDPLLVVL